MQQKFRDNMERASFSGERARRASEQSRRASYDFYASERARARISEFSGERASELLALALVKILHSGASLRKLSFQSKQSSSSPTSGSSMQMEGAQFEKLSLNTTSTASTV